MAPGTSPVFLTDDNQPLLQLDTHASNDACHLMYQRVEDGDSVRGPPAPPPRGLERQPATPSCFLNCVLQLAAQCNHLMRAVSSAVRSVPSGTDAASGQSTVAEKFPEFRNIPLPPGKDYANAVSLVIGRALSTTQLKGWGAISGSLSGMASALVKVLNVLQIRTEYEAVLLTPEQLLTDREFVSGMFPIVVGEFNRYKVLRRDTEGTMWVISPDIALCRGIAPEDVQAVNLCVCLRNKVRGGRLPMPPHARSRGPRLLEPACYPRER